MSTKNIVYIALFCALTAALGLAPPVTVGFLPVPITAQTLGVMIAGGVLGATRGGLSQALFVLLVAIGLPLLAGGRGGLGIFGGASGGFVLAFPIGAFVVGLLIEMFWRRLNVVTAFIACVLGGVGAVYPLGVLWWSIAADQPLADVVVAASVFIPGDLVKAGLAAIIIVAVRQAYPLIAARRGG